MPSGIVEHLLSDPLGSEKVEEAAVSISVWCNGRRLSSRPHSHLRYSDRLLVEPSGGACQAASGQPGGASVLPGPDLMEAFVGATGQLLESVLTEQHSG